MSLLARLADQFPASPARVRLKAALLYAGVRYHESLAEAADWAFPNYMPYILPPGVAAFRGQRKVNLPYLVRMADDTQVRLRVKPDSPFEIRPDGSPLGFGLFYGPDQTLLTSLTFEPRLAWVDALTGDGTPMRHTGLSQHGEMLVLNIAPGCEYFVVPEGEKTRNLSCSFCLYGLPDKRLDSLGQRLYEAGLPPATVKRVVEACAHPDTRATQLYLVGGSMLDMAKEGERYVQIARALKDVGLTDRYYVAAGSGALERKHMEELKDLGVRGACFNMEVWDAAQFARVCPGKDQIVGRQRWIDSLEEAVDVFGKANVMTAFVGGVELDGEGAMTDARRALESNLEAAEYFIPRGVQTIYSLHWKVTGKDRGQEPVYSLDLFLELNERLAAIRKRENRLINPAFFSRRSAYMQLEPDYDEEPA
ncbi:MAG: hypothetical protein KC613_03290 [Myxococcales bacterium]|nr:hypothetical protein [Myxococcales bacterium]MCB9524404.1 hypothetical protein [Myxococcales bacterium]